MRRKWWLAHPKNTLAVGVSTCFNYFLMSSGNGEIEVLQWGVLVTMNTFLLQSMTLPLLFVRYEQKSAEGFLKRRSEWTDL